MSLRDDFNSEVREAIRKCYEIGYMPTRFEQMIKQRHPVEVAKHLIPNYPQYGFNKLVSLGRPELTIEAIMLKERFSSLFTEEELRAARWRLDNAGEGA